MHRGEEFCGPGNMRRSIIAILAAMTMALQGCGAPRYSSEALEANAASPYLLASGDRLRIIVFGQDALSNSYGVDGAGRISMPLIGNVDAFGHSTTQLERIIENRLRGGFLREPRVSVEVEAFRPFFILGEVITAGQFPFINGMTVQNAVAVAGGFGPRANRYYADVTRVINGVPVTGSVPLTFPVLPGDTITIRERFF